MRPTTIVIFVEGTRFTKEKKISRNTLFHNVLAPKATGMAFTLNALGGQFDRILNVTLLYPDNHQRPFLDLIRGQVKRIMVRVETLPVNDQIRGDYFNDKVFKRQFQDWLNELWIRKDPQLTQLKERDHQFSNKKSVS